MKIKDMCLKIKESDFKRDLVYEEYLDKFVKEPSSKELEEMYKNIKQPLNNLNYLPPLIGA